MNMAGKLKREGRATQSRHVAEVLAGMADGRRSGSDGMIRAWPSSPDMTGIIGAAAQTRCSLRKLLRRQL
jgi:hypothetical protein